MPIDRSGMKLGALPSPDDDQRLYLVDYLVPAELPKVPVQTIYYQAVTKPWGMLGNATKGDCTLAGLAHQFQLHAANQGNQIQFDEATILKIYDQMTGGVDSGLTLLDVLKYGQKTGVQGHKIGAYVQVNLRSIVQVKAAIYLFGGLYAAVDLPIASQNQTIWDVPKGGLTGDGAPGSWGGHCVPVSDYAPYGYMCQTWGDDMPMTKRYFNAYFVEGWAIISEDWVNGNKKAPNGFDLNTLQADLKVIKGK